MSVLAFREGRSSDLRATFELAELTWDASRSSATCCPRTTRAQPRSSRPNGRPERALLEFIEAQPSGAYLLGEEGDEIVGYTQIARFGSMDELTELWVAPSHSGRGVGRALLERCRTGSPTPDLGRVVLGLGMNADLSLFMGFGAKPVSGHWHLSAPARGVPGAPLSRSRHERTGGARPDGRARGERVEGARAARHRPREAAAARVLRPHPHLPGHNGRPGGRGWRSAG